MSGELAEDQNVEMPCSDQSQSSEEESFQFQFQQMYLIAQHDTLHELQSYSIYKIDVSSSSSNIIDNNDGSGSQPLDPILTLDMDDDDISGCCFAICQHTFYVFGGMDEEFPNAWRNDFRFFEMNNSAFFLSTILPISDMVIGQSFMKGRKFEPVAVLVDETRICVFSCMLSLDENFIYDPQIFGPPNFELFDTTTHTWIQLDEPTKYSGVAYITSYFTSYKTLTISTSVGDYQMKFDVPHPSWVEVVSEIPISPDFGYRCHGILIDDQDIEHKQILFSPFHYMKWDKSSAAKPYSNQAVQIKAEGWRKRVASRGLFGGLCLRDGFVFSVRVVYEKIWSESVPHLLVDIIKNDSEFASRLSESKEIEAFRSFTFTLNSLRGHKIIMLQCFPVKTLKRPYGHYTLPAKRFNVDSDNLTY